MAEEFVGPGLRAELREQGGIAVVSPAGAVDTATAYILQNALIEAIARAPNLLVVDMTGVDFIDSAGLGVLVMALKRMTQRRAALRLVVPDPHVREIFEYTGLERVFALFQDANAARKAPL